MEGAYAADSLPRVAEMLFAPSGEVGVSLTFGTDDAARPAVTGRIRASLVLQCQRCLEGVTVEVEASPRLVVCRSEAEAERLPEGVEPMMYEGEPLSVRELVEDELILALPIVPRHGGQCVAVPDGRDGDEGEQASDTQRPFRDLRKLLDRDE